ncbi:MAG TPA: cytochrome c [Candidatus Binatia bacterium]|nr:cytochrome c [Candidatus Binatia bacterium]
MKGTLLRFLTLASAVAVLGATYGTVSIKFPTFNVPFKPGPGQDVTIANCRTCHSAAYVYTQPPLTKAQWTAEVIKMRNAYKAPIADADVPTIADYLVTQNGKQ